MLNIRKKDTSYLEMKYPASKLFSNPAHAPGAACYQVILLNDILKEIKKLNKHMEIKNCEHDRVEK